MKRSQKVDEKQEPLVAVEMPGGSCFSIAQGTVEEKLAGKSFSTEEEHQGGKGEEQEEQGGDAHQQRAQDHDDSAAEPIHQIASGSTGQNTK